MAKLPDEIQVAIDCAMELVHPRAYEDLPRPLCHLAWNAIHRASRACIDASRMRLLLALALYVGKSERMTRSQLCGMDRGRLNVSGLGWWAGERYEPENFKMPVKTLREFIAGRMTEAAFKAEIQTRVKREMQRMRLYRVDEPRSE